MIRLTGNHPVRGSFTVEIDVLQVSTTEKKWLPAMEAIAKEYAPENGDTELWLAGRLSKLMDLQVVQTHEPVAEDDVP